MAKRCWVTSLRIRRPRSRCIFTLPRLDLSRSGILILNHVYSQCTHLSMSHILFLHVSYLTLSRSSSSTTLLTASFLPSFANARWYYDAYTEEFNVASELCSKETQRKLFKRFTILCHFIGQHSVITHGHVAYRKYQVARVLSHIWCKIASVRWLNKLCYEFKLDIDVYALFCLLVCRI